MKKFLTTVALAATMFATPATAFYNEDVGNWAVYGDEGNQELNPACVVEYMWQDGSTFQLIYDLSTRELYIWFRNFEWDIADPVDQYYEMQMIMDGRRGMSSSGATYLLINKNTIVIPNIHVDAFMVPFMQLAELRMIMPGTIQNAYLDLAGSRMASQSLFRCVEIGDTMDFYEDVGDVPL
jgi:hypothetical protein